MATRKYHFEKMTQDELAALGMIYPKAVKSVTKLRPNYSIIAQLLNCGVEVPGLRLTGAQSESSLTGSGDVLPGEIPAFYNKIDA